jgi:hypothetical protein
MFRFRVKVAVTVMKDIDACTGLVSPANIGFGRLYFAAHLINPLN